jgi:hypothetical protein
MTLIRPSGDMQPARPAEKKTAMTTLNGASKMQLLNEALSRARMRRPQAGRNTTSSEANRSARTVAMEARRRAARELGAL